MSALNLVFCGINILKPKLGSHGNKQKGWKSCSPGCRFPKRGKGKARISRGGVVSATIAPSLKPDLTENFDKGSQYLEGIEEHTDKFTWKDHWYPVSLVEDLDPKIPTPFQLLGREIVLWQDTQGNWRAFDDKCPHRLAPLSEGRVDENGWLQCSYHGWSFKEDGSCGRIPQAASEGPEAQALRSPRACAVSFPTLVSQGLLFVWPDEKGWERSSKTKPPMLPEAFSDPRFSTVTIQRDLFYGYDTLMENVSDPSHIDFAHHKLVPRWHEHWTSNKVYDGDMIVLQGQEKSFLANASQDGCDVNKEYTKLTFTPTQADRFVLAFRNWLRLHGNGQPEWLVPITSGQPPPSTILSKQQMLDRYEQHTLKCSSCKNAFETFQLLQKFLLGATVVFAATAGIPSELQFRIILASAAFVSAGLAYILKELEQNFKFIDYVHAKID
ncbi:pheophorbide a oxygenase, chloroplastic isoform X2 [Cryptomeria japonica]|uniref:pheophorbide a oxygenase, chloroplastic isoform X2 n=1 Tax=Cryptomeria japonica TaxID=3369 RepID=UPI0027D9EB4A|nr:pheophorbide a oxygenase, chloroplastic isoform X2 [Cryptomeria japonica]